MAALPAPTNPLIGPLEPPVSTSTTTSRARHGLQSVNSDRKSPHSTEVACPPIPDQQPHSANTGRVVADPCAVCSAR